MNIPDSLTNVWELSSPFKAQSLTVSSPPVSPSDLSTFRKNVQLWKRLKHSAVFPVRPAAPTLKDRAAFKLANSF